MIDQRPLRAQLSRLAGANARELERTRPHIPAPGGRPALRRHLLFALADRTARSGTIRAPGLSDRNIRSLIAFVEEINHALHAALQFKKGEREIASEDFARNLELQARVDTYLVLLLFVAFFRKTQRVSRTDRRWLRFHLFAAENPGAFQSTNLRSRYLESTELAARYAEISRYAECDAAPRRNSRVSLTRLRREESARCWRSPRKEDRRAA